MKFRRQYAHDRVNDVVKRENLSKGIFLSAKMTLEKRIAQDRDVASVRICSRRN